MDASVIGCAFPARRRRVSHKRNQLSERESSDMGTELSLPVVVKRVEAVICASERMA
jgi:hypothetical protein